MSLTSKQIYDLNNMNIAAQNVALGNEIDSFQDAYDNIGLMNTISHKVLSTEISGATTTVILTNPNGAIEGFIINAFSNNALVSITSATIGSDADTNKLTVVAASSNLPADSIINVIFF